MDVEVVGDYDVADAAESGGCIPGGPVMAGCNLSDADSGLAGKVLGSDGSGDR